MWNQGPVERGTRTDEGREPGVRLERAPGAASGSFGAGLRAEGEWARRGPDGARREIEIVDDPDGEPSPEQIAAVMARLRGGQRFGRGVAAGVVACGVGALAWAAITAITRWQIDWMAVGVGALVGFAIRRFGRGVEPRFGVVGAGLALAGCVLGNFLAVYGLVAAELHIPLGTVLTELGPGAVAEHLVESMGLYDVLFYGIALYQGYRLSFREVTYAEILLQPETAGGGAGAEPVPEARRVSVQR